MMSRTSPLVRVAVLIVNLIGFASEATTGNGIVFALVVPSVAKRISSPTATFDVYSNAKLAPSASMMSHPDAGRSPCTSGRNRPENPSILSTVAPPTVIATRKGSNEYPDALGGMGPDFRNCPPVWLYVATGVHP